MTFTFKEYTIIADAIVAAQAEEVDEGVLDALQAVKAKLTGKPNLADLEKKYGKDAIAKIKAEVEAKTSKIKSKEAEKSELEISKTNASKEFHARRASAKPAMNIHKAASYMAQPTQKTLSAADRASYAKNIAFKKGMQAEELDEALNEEVADDSMFFVHVPANVYAGKYYDFRTVPILVLAKDEAEASSIVNKNKDDVIRFYDSRRISPSGKFLVRHENGTDKNVFFKKDYYVKPTAMTSSSAVLTRHGGFKRVTLDKNKEIEFSEPPVRTPPKAKR